MLIEELDIAGIKALGDFLADLMRAATLDHVQPGPAVLCFRAGRSSHEEGVLQLPLQIILLNMVCEGGGNFPEDTPLATKRCQRTQTDDILGIPNASKPRPADIRAIGEVADQILRLSQFAEVGGSLDAAS